MFSLSNMSIQWDEVTHLNGGALLLRGDFQTYFSFNAFYPPMYDLLTTSFFSVGGVSVFAGRFVSVVFSVLSLYAVFEFTHRVYGQKTALLASIFLGIMPGYVWLSRMAMIETMLINGVAVRPANAADVPEITRIYNEGIRDRLATL